MSASKPALTKKKPQSFPTWISFYDSINANGQVGLDKVISIPTAPVEVWDEPGIAYYSVRYVQEQAFAEFQKCRLSAQEETILNTLLTAGLAQFKSSPEYLDYDTASVRISAKVGVTAEYQTEADPVPGIIRLE